MGIPEQTVDRDASLDQEAVRTCRICGCTDDQACPSGCWWVEDEDIFSDLCSACAPFLDALPQLLGLFRALEELAHEGTTVTGWARAWEAFDKVDALQRPEPASSGEGLLFGGAVRQSGRTSRLTDGEQAAAIDATRVLDECELHFLTDCGESAEADVIALERGLP